MDGRWGVVGVLVQRFATTTALHVRCASPFDAGVERGEAGGVYCGLGELVDCFVEVESPWWFRRFGYDVCASFFDCDIHKCEKLCHRPSTHHPNALIPLFMSPTVLV